MTSTLTIARQALSAWRLERFQLDLAEGLLPVDRQAAIAVFRAQVAIAPNGDGVALHCASTDHLQALRSASATLRVLTRRNQVDHLLLVDPGGRQIPISAHTIRSRYMNAPDIARPGFHLAQMRLDRPLMEVVLKMYENPEWMCGIVDARTEQQVLLSESAARIILGTEMDRLDSDAIQQKLAAATAMKREDYFYLPDLEVFRRDIQGLEPNNPQSTVVLRPRMKARDGNVYRYVHEYCAITDDFGRLYHVGRSVDVEPVNLTF